MMRARPYAMGTFTRSSWLYLRLLGVLYVAAFVSFGVQVPGLIGSQGIEPAAPLLLNLEARGFGWWDFPTLCWLSASDLALTLHWVVGALLGAVLAVGIVPHISSALCWVFYLSLVVIGRSFMAYQWDNLLLEAGLIAIFLSPWVVWSKPSRPGTAPPVARGLCLFLLFRLLFSSGFVKFMGQDPTWKALTALDYHYETQPLPTWIGYFWHHLPAGWHKLECVGVVIEQLFLPFAIFLPRLVRHPVAMALFGLQVLIALTGNYGFFNFLSMALCVLLFDDQALQRILRFVRADVPRVSMPQKVFVAMGCAPLLVLATLTFMGTVGGPSSAAAQKWMSKVGRFRSINRYGLFAMMTTKRDEIVIEGSDDGQTWRAYVLPYQPGPVDRHPEFMAPHMPRLDWGMWFAALGSPNHYPWFRTLMYRLLEGSPDVLALFEHNPFDERPPRFVRALRYRYEFSESGSDDWWVRRYVGVYLPPMQR